MDKQSINSKPKKYLDPFIYPFTSRIVNIILSYSNLSHVHLKVTYGHSVYWSSAICLFVQYKLNILEEAWMAQRLIMLLLLFILQFWNSNIRRFSCVDVALNIFLKIKVSSCSFRKEF